MKIFIIAAVIAVLSGMGVGGGGLLVIYLTLFENTPQLIAQGANLCFFILSAITSTLFNAKRHKIVWKTTLAMSGAGVLAALLGSMIAGIIDPSILRKLFGGMLVLGGVNSLFGKLKKNSSGT